MEWANQTHSMPLGVYHKKNIPTPTHPKAAQATR